MSSKPQYWFSNTTTSYDIARLHIWWNSTPFLLQWPSIGWNWTILEDDLKSQDSIRMKYFWTLNLLRQKSFPQNILVCKFVKAPRKIYFHSKNIPQTRKKKIYKILGNHPGQAYVMFLPYDIVGDAMIVRSLLSITE